MPTAGREFKRQPQLIVPVPLKQLAYRIADEPGEGNTVFLRQRRQLLVVPFVDADRDPCRQLFPAPGSHRSLYPPKHCITVVNGDAMYCEAMSHVNCRVIDS
jgi:hypothetical protein